MQVVREKPCQRRHHRVTAPMKVTLPNGEQTTASDWSLGGVRLDGVASELPGNGEELKLIFELPFQGFDISFDVKARVIRLNEQTKTVAFEYTSLSERASDLMNHFIDDLVRGQMATVEDTICRIDIPVTPISTKPDVNPVEEIPVRRLPVKTIAMSSFYAVLGVVVFGYLGVLLYSNLMRMEVTSAVVSKPLVTLKMPMDGMLVPVNFANGKYIKKGDQIARIISAKIEQEVLELEAEYQAKKRDQDLAREKFRIENERMKVYKLVSRTDNEIAKARASAASEALSAADIAYERAVRLLKKGLITNPEVDEALKRRNESAARLREVESELERTTVMERVSDRRYFNHKEFVADLDMLALDLEAKNAQLNDVHIRLKQLYKVKDSLVIASPFDSRIVSIKEVANTTVLRDVDILTLEKDVAPTITAFLSQDEVLSVGLNDEAKVFLPSSGTELVARVQRIDRNSSFLETNKSHYVWKDGNEKSAAVSLSIEADTSNETIRAGTPAIVLFSKRNTNDILNKVGKTIKFWANRVRINDREI